MVNSMALLAQILTTMIYLVTWPFSVFFHACLFGIKTIFIIIQTWLELVRASISLHVNWLWKTLMWTLALISLPDRILAALQRERQLELYLQDMQIELENLVLDKKELYKHLQNTIKERKMMELIFGELAEEYDKASTRIEQLENQLQDLRNENFRLKEIQGQEYWRHKCEAKKGPYSNSGSSISVQDLWSETKSELQKILKSAKINSKNGDIIEILDEQRRVALSRSFFTAVLSLLVGMIIWEAENPCLPLVMALLTVVGISLNSVVQFFSTIRNKPALDSVILLCLNWFILGMLTYPTMPRVSRMVTPLVLRFVDHVLIWLGISGG